MDTQGYPYVHDSRRSEAARMNGRAGTGSRVEILTDTDALGAILEPWRAAAVRLGNAFMTPEWFFSFLDHAPSARPFVVVVEKEGRLQGLLPLVEDGLSLRFPGSQIGDLYQPLLIDIEDETVIERAMAGLISYGPRWKVAVFDKVDPAMANRIRDVTEGGGTHRALVGGRHSLPTIELGAMTWDQYLQERSHNFRSEIRRKERALARDHEVEFVETRDADQLIDALRKHFVLHDKRWADHPSHRSPYWVRPFLSSFATQAAAQGWLRIWRLSVDGEPAASWFGWSIGGRYSYYQAGLDVSRSRLSAGSLLLAQTIRASIEEGCSVYDFLLGDESYKQRFTNRDREVTTLVAASRFSPRLGVVAAGWRLQAEMQKLPPGIKQTLRALRRSRRG